jgi:hypothetical protein
MEAFYVHGKIRIVFDSCVLRKLGRGTNPTRRWCAASGRFRGAKFLARNHRGTGNCHTTSQHSYPACANSYAARGHGNSTNKSSAGIGRADGSPSERDNSGRDAWIELAIDADSGHCTAINRNPQQSRDNSERNSLCDTGNAERLDSECGIVESRIAESRFNNSRVDQSEHT